MLCGRRQEKLSRKDNKKFEKSLMFEGSFWILGGLNPGTVFCFWTNKRGPRKILKLSVGMVVNFWLPGELAQADCIEHGVQP